METERDGAAAGHDGPTSRPDEPSRLADDDGGVIFVTTLPVGVSVNVEKRVDEPGSAEHAEEAWELKERIRTSEGVLKQRRGFFMDAYRRSKTHLLYLDGDLVGFAALVGSPTGSVLEGRVADVVALDRIARNTLWEAIEAFSHDEGVDVIAAFAPSAPNDRWIRIRRHVLMWNEISRDADPFAPDRWELGFYDVV